MKGKYLIDVRDAPPPVQKGPGCAEIFMLIIVGVLVLFVITGGLR